MTWTSAALARHAIGLLLGIAILWGADHMLSTYGQYANVARWTGENSLGWLRPWLIEFRMPLLCVGGFLALSVLSWVWQRLRLGH